MGHLAAMTLYAALLSVFFATLWRRERPAQIKLFARIFGSLLLGAIALGWPEKRPDKQPRKPIDKVVTWHE